MREEIPASRFDPGYALMRSSEFWDRLYKGKDQALAIKITHLQVMNAVYETLAELPLSGKIRMDSYGGGRVTVAVKGADNSRVGFTIQTTYDYGGNSVSFAVNSYHRWCTKNAARSFRLWHTPERIHAKVRGMILAKVKFLHGSQYVGPKFG